MEDLPNDVALGKILGHFHQKSRPTALICHGPIALLAHKAYAGEKGWVYKGYQATIVSANEEKEEESAGHLGGRQLYYVEEALSQAGVKVLVANPWSPHAIRDREVITGQNPMSAKPLVSLFMQALREKIHSIASQANLGGYLRCRRARLPPTSAKR